MKPTLLVSFVFFLTSCGLTGDDSCGAESTELVITYTTTDEVKALAKCSNIVGQVHIDGAGGGISIENLSFDNLVTIEQGLEIKLVDGLQTISFPKLKRTATDGRFNTALSFGGNNSLRSISAPLLETMGDEEVGGGGGPIIIYDSSIDSVDFSSLRFLGALQVTNAGPPEFALPSLTFIGGGVTFESAEIESFTMPAAANDGARLVLTDNLFLENFEVPGTDFADVTVQGNPEMTVLDVSSVTNAPITLTDNGLSEVRLGALTLAEQFVVEDNAGLVALSAPVLEQVTVGNFHAMSNPQLNSLSMPSLTFVDGVVRIQDNPMLPDCHVKAVWDQTDQVTTLPDTNLGDGCP